MKRVGVRWAEREGLLLGGGGRGRGGVVSRDLGPSRG